ncbi:PLDc N-terminal domain-containing protein [Paraflavisolibacter sp. H34]|uniref:PLDc N-terminal domain-containing protein n=1 Tax=Huijunlia imazamoxiresistens TaxID=3127457 RepID=UPI003017BB92
MSLLTPSIMLIIFSMMAFVSLIVMIIALVDLLRSDFKGRYDKLIWVLLILFLPFLLGPILYYFIGRNQKRAPQEGLL